MISDDRFKRLQWHSRRGMLELDVLLEPFTNNVFKSLSEEDQNHYLRLVDCEDPDLFSWFMSGQRPEDSGLSKMLDVVLQHARGNLPDVSASQ